MIKYDYHYYYNLLKIQTEYAKKVSDARWDFIKDNILKHETLPDTKVLDYGCGIGFMKVFVPEWVGLIDTFDILPVPQTGILNDSYDIVLLYDVLEHIPDFRSIESVIKKSKYIVTSVPVKPTDLPWDQYKHFKPGEHLHYFTDSLLLHIFQYMGFRFITQGTPECPPREHVKTYIFRNNE